MGQHLATIEAVQETFILRTIERDDADELAMKYGITIPNRYRLESLVRVSAMNMFEDESKVMAVVETRSDVSELVAPHVVCYSPWATDVMHASGAEQALIGMVVLAVRSINEGIKVTVSISEFARDSARDIEEHRRNLKARREELGE
jgi:hypothetical protein